jgi:hypothetical protein
VRGLVLAHRRASARTRRVAWADADPAGKSIAGVALGTSEARVRAKLGHPTYTVRGAVGFGSDGASCASDGGATVWVASPQRHHHNEVLLESERLARARVTEVEVSRS